MNNKFYPVAFLLLIGVAAYIMFGDAFKPNVDLAQYMEVCNKYQAAKAGTYTNAEIQMLVNELGYLLPEAKSEINDATKLELKACVAELAGRLSE